MKLTINTLFYIKEEIKQGRIKVNDVLANRMISGIKFNRQLCISRYSAKKINNLCKKPEYSSRKHNDLEDFDEKDCLKQKDIKHIVQALSDLKIGGESKASMVTRQDKSAGALSDRSICTSNSNVERDNLNFQKKDAIKYRKQRRNLKAIEGHSLRDLLESDDSDKEN
ncbi:hypothetical protein DID75_01435 [Candidatus Marinamargulisbacteria bacterium SCGC AG-410-N11]|nr:hypothetical protein DID75_01435 [Candidatus Marinamargulisbacteria bacterium SCGC AG-410-N11]